MTYYLKGTYLQKKKGKLHIYVRNNKDSKGRLKSKFYVGRTYIQGKQKIISSGSNNLNKAKVILSKWYDELQTMKKFDITIHQNSVKDLYNKWLYEIENSTEIEQRTKKWYKERWNYIVKCSDFMKLKVNTMTATDIKNTYITWRFNRAKSQSKVLRGSTLKGDLMAISGFCTWSYKKKIRKDKLENILTKTLQLVLIVLHHFLQLQMANFT